MITYYVFQEQQQLLLLHKLLQHIQKLLMRSFLQIEVIMFHFYLVLLNYGYTNLQKLFLPFYLFHHSKKRIIALTLQQLMLLFHLYHLNYIEINQWWKSCRITHHHQYVSFLNVQPNGTSRIYLLYNNCRRMYKMGFYSHYNFLEQPTQAYPNGFVISSHYKLHLLFKYIFYIILLLLIHN